MSVVLRCPTCGTTQGRPGECEACSEGTVRYFCDNHAPGLWLDSPECKVCGARFGKEAPRGPGPERASRAAPSVPIHRTRRPGDDRIGPSGRGEATPAGVRRPSPRVVEPDDDGPAAPSLRDLLAHLAAERERSEVVEEEELPPPAPAPAAPGRSPFLGGCLIRLLLLALLLIVLALTGVLVLVGSIFR